VPASQWPAQAWGPQLVLPVQGRPATWNKALALGVAALVCGVGGCILSLVASARAVDLDRGWRFATEAQFESGRTTVYVTAIIALIGAVGALVMGILAIALGRQGAPLVLGILAIVLSLPIFLLVLGSMDLASDAQLYRLR
jgi:peptidoglycan/LPS O-acetylase OafA/YrhL